ncbi:MAG: ribose 5-phosphate isomerase B [Verrucomicrobiota bacterium]
MKIAIASDHAGLLYKRKIISFLEKEGHEVKDYGTDKPESCDYPDFIRPAAEAVANGEYERGIVLGGSGNGEAIVANKVKGVRCGLCWSVETARLNRLHNDGNVISIGERVTPEDLVLEIVKTWLETKFEGGRHIQRIQKIE